MLFENANMERLLRKWESLSIESDEAFQSTAKELKDAICIVVACEEYVSELLEAMIAEQRRNWV